MYKAILFALDGDWVTDFKGDTIQEVIDWLADRGSRWYFYPLEGVIRAEGSSDRKRVVDMAPPLGFLKGKSIKTVKKFIEDNSENIVAEIT